MRLSPALAGVLAAFALAGRDDSGIGIVIALAAAAFLWIAAEAIVLGPHRHHLAAPVRRAGHP